MLRPYLPEFLFNILSFISKYKIFGFIPLNATLHLSISALLTYIFIKKGHSAKKTFIIIFFIGLMKEFFDSQALGNTWTKHTRDMCLNLFFPTIMIGVHYLKFKIKDHNLNKSNES